VVTYLPHCETLHFSKTIILIKVYICLLNIIYCILLLILAWIIWFMSYLSTFRHIWNPIDYLLNTLFVCLRHKTIWELHDEYLNRTISKTVKVIVMQYMTLYKYSTAEIYRILEGHAAGWYDKQVPHLCHTHSHTRACTHKMSF
jgi:uncharacterized membrane protein YbhN (UPF0104 family)